MDCRSCRPATSELGRETQLEETGAHDLQRLLPVGVEIALQQDRSSVEDVMYVEIRGHLASAETEDLPNPDVKQVCPWHVLCARFDQADGHILHATRQWTTERGPHG